MEKMERGMERKRIKRKENTETSNWIKKTRTMRVKKY